MKSKLLQVLFVVVFLLAGINANAEDLNNVVAPAVNLGALMEGKKTFFTGLCHFKNGEFISFASGLSFFANEVIDKISPCLLMGDSKATLPPIPALFVLLDKDGFPTEIFLMRANDKPKDIRSVWKMGAAEKNEQPQKPAEEIPATPPVNRSVNKVGI